MLNDDNTSMTSPLNDDNYEVNDLLQVENIVNKIYSGYGILLLLLGLTGNSLLILVARCDQSLGLSTRIFLAALALSDTGTLASAALWFWFPVIFGVDLLEGSKPACRALKFSMLALADLSAFILCAVSGVRLCAIALPTKRHLKLSGRSACLLLVALVLFASLANSISIFNDKPCGDLPSSYAVVYAIVAAGVYVCLSGTSLATSVLLKCRVRKVSQHQSSDPSQIIQRSMLVAHRMFLVNTFLYLAAALPVLVYWLVRSFHLPVKNTERNVTLDTMLLSGFVYIKMVTNSTRFYIGLWCSKQFRIVISSVLCNRLKPSNTNIDQR